METEKDIFGKAHSNNMGEEEKPRYSLPERDERPKYGLPERNDQPSFNYESHLDRAKTGKPSFDAYVESLSRETQIYDKKYSHKKGSLKSVIKKADAFLRRHAGISYQDFLRQSTPETLTGEDYEHLQPQERTRYFERDTLTKLAALEDIEKRGYNVDEILGNFEQVYGKVKKRRAREGLLESLVSRQGEIFERFLRNKDSESLYRDLRKFSEEILDIGDDLPQAELGVIDTIYHHIYEMEKFLESQSEEIL